MNQAMKQNRAMITAAVAVVLVVGAALAMKIAGAGKDNLKTVCALQATSQADILDTTKSNTREDLVASIRERASLMEKSAGSTEGAVHDAFTTYSEALRKVASAIEEDKTGEQLNNIVASLSEDAAVEKAGMAIAAIIDTECG